MHARQEAGFRDGPWCIEGQHTGDAALQEQTLVTDSIHT